ncbi:MAG TPA: outer membrane beta-barrel protein [Thermoanaerobaculia bacterium]|nr:outer membrane beta-barrel protein [Thermoanaerobaculia bacterium]
MKKLVLAAALCAAVVLVSAPAAAQGTGGFQFGLTGGLTKPNGTTSDTFDNGYHGGLVLNYELPALPLGLRVDGDYHRLDAKTGASGASGSAEIIDGNANLVLGLRILVVKVYVLGGAGVYYNRFSGSAGGRSGTTLSETDFGWNAGAGAAFVVGKVSIFVEGRYHEVTLDNSAGKFKFIPVTAGILF